MATLHPKYTRWQAACRSIQPGDYLEADGEKQHEFLFHADSVEIRRNGQRVR